MEPPLPQPPASETSQFYSSATRPVRVGSLLLQSVAVTVPTFSKELDLGSIANPQKHSTIKQYLFASLLFKPLAALLLDCFSLVFLSAWVRGSVGKGNSSGLVIYALATTGSLAIVAYGGWRASQVLKKGHIQAIFVNREAYRWVCLKSRDRFFFFERVGQGYGQRDALAFFAWFTLRDWMQHLLCDLPRLVINSTILAQVAHQRSLISRGLQLGSVPGRLGRPAPCAHGQIGSAEKGRAPPYVLPEESERQNRPPLQTRQIGNNSTASGEQSTGAADESIQNG
ncbi:hypothetical protein BC939DRAFT_4196 [Gamsiella multidivaricata]|uniref:uncharacterized protein n=1 Tax=Gamsiella multidivaricata TaxID=101098 RepID=UPI002220CF62|nr:uncharacterized protein BC939DRAFT_4196 [Gamsiella multidivaricata]KAI7832709.1 hypothetical protein BC939DRAFT_4196 [Gamsiella multidivaricata]